MLGAPRGEGVVEWRLVDALAIWGYSMVVYVPVSVGPFLDISSGSSADACFVRLDPVCDTDSDPEVDPRRRRRYLIRILPVRPTRHLLLPR